MATPSPKVHYAQICAANGCRVNAQLMKDLPDTIESLVALKKLNFSLSTLGSSDIGPLAMAVLQHCSNLRTLNVSQNYLTDDSVILLCETLAEHCSNLMYLDLSNNPLSNRTGRYLLRLMDTMPALQCISVQKTLMNNTMLRNFSQAPQPRRRSASQQVRPFSLKSSTFFSHEEGRFLSCPTASSRSVDKDAVEHGSSKKKWSALNTLWRAAAVAAPIGQDYSGLDTLITFTKTEDL